MKKQLTHFIRLLNFEFERMYKFLVGIMAVVVVSNLIGFIVVPLSYMREATSQMRINDWTAQQYTENINFFSIFNLYNSIWLWGPIVLGFTGLLIYSVFIWYREWLGKNTFIYRLLMLPCSRMNLFFSKLITILLGIFSLVSLQVIMLFIGGLIAPLIVSKSLFLKVSVYNLVASSRLSLMLPQTWLEFFGIYVLGAILLMILFTGILLERSYKMKGFVLGIIYFVVSSWVILSPLMIPIVMKNQYILFDSEIALLIALMSILMGIISLLISAYLLKHKITV